MTLFQDIQSAQSLLLPPYASKRLLVRSPVSVVETFNPDKLNLWQFDPIHYDSGDSDSYVYLVLFPQYTPEDDSFGEQTYKNTFSRSAVFAPTTIRRGATIEVKQSSRVIFDIINQLSLISKTSSFSTHAPIKIIDFCRAEAEDINNVTSEGDVGTIRWGRIDVKKQPTFITSISKEYCLEPWEFKFSETNLRIH